MQNSQKCQRQKFTRMYFEPITRSCPTNISASFCRVFQSFKMKVIILLMIIVCCGSNCNEKLWRGKSILCCQNSTAFRTSEKTICTKEIPLACGIAPTEATEESMSAGMLTFIIGGGILCRCGPLFIVTANMMYRFCHHD